MTNNRRLRLHFFSPVGDGDGEPHQLGIAQLYTVHVQRGHIVQMHSFHRLVTSDRAANQREVLKWEKECLR